MNDSEGKYSNEKMMEIGRMNVEGGKSIRQLAREFGVSKSTVSKAKDVYLAYSDGKQTGKQEKEREMEEKVNRLENRVQQLSSKDREVNSGGSSEIDVQDYLRNPDQDEADKKDDEEKEDSGWKWVAAGIGTLVAAAGIIFRNTIE